MAENNISVEQVEHVAKLSNLPITKEEAQKYSKLFTDTLDYINKLDELDTKDVVRTFQVTGLKNVFQKGDSNKATLGQENSLKNAKRKENGFFATEAVFDRE